jgi:outer membrane protein OmpA-like peptidoglycan-associated protein
MEVEARNLPRIPSTGRIEAGRVENQRVEIHCDATGILDPVQSTYIEIKSDVDAVRLIPDIVAEHGLASWEITLYSDRGPLKTLKGDGAALNDIALSSGEFSPEKLAGYGSLEARAVVTDLEGQTFETTAGPVRINFIQVEKRRAQNLGYMVEEKYALILFDFDRADVKDRNAAIVKRIADRMKERPDAAVNIVGHTDDIGKERYNIKLSERRAKAVYDRIAAAGQDKKQVIQYSGVGPADPLYENNFPENRALNRTVTVTLVYEQMD